MASASPCPVRVFCSHGEGANVRSTVDRLTAILKALSAVTLAAMMFLTCADVLGRAAGHPILGAVELGVLMAALVLAFAMPYAHREKAHVGVEILYMRLGDRAQAFLDVFTGTAAMTMFGIIGWRSADYAGQMRASGEVSMTLQLPVHYIIYLISASFWVLTLVQLLDVIESVRRGVSR